MKNNMIKETKSELKKVIWPSRKDVLNGTVVVAVMVILVGIIIFAFDLLSSEVVKLIIGADGSSISDIVEHDHDHNHEEEKPIDNSGENVQGNTENSPEESSEPTIDNNVVTE